MEPPFDDPAGPLHHLHRSESRRVRLVHHLRGRGHAADAEPGPRLGREVLPGSPQHRQVARPARDAQHVPVGRRLAVGDREPPQQGARDGCGLLRHLRRRLHVARATPPGPDRGPRFHRHGHLSHLVALPQGQPPPGSPLRPVHDHRPGALRHGHHRLHHHAHGAVQLRLVPRHGMELRVVALDHCTEAGLPAPQLEAQRPQGGAHRGHPLHGPGRPHRGVPVRGIRGDGHPGCAQGRRRDRPGVPERGIRGRQGRPRVTRATRASRQPRRCEADHLSVSLCVPWVTMSAYTAELYKPQQPS